MSDVPDVEAVETEDDYIHVRFRDPDQFDTVRTSAPSETDSAAFSAQSGVRISSKSSGFR